MIDERYHFVQKNVFSPMPTNLRVTNSIWVVTACEQLKISSDVYIRNIWTNPSLFREKG